MKFPKTYMHRSNHASQVVVANEEQEAALPSDFIPLDGSPSGATGAVPGIDPEGELSEREKVSPGAINSLAEANADLDARRKQFDAAVDDFATHVRNKEQELTNLREQLDAENERVTGLRKELEKARADAEAAQLNDAAKVITASAKAEEEQAAAAPAKRTRAKD